MIYDKMCLLTHMSSTYDVLTHVRYPHICIIVILQLKHSNKIKSYYVKTWYMIKCVYRHISLVHSTFEPLD